MLRISPVVNMERLEQVSSSGLSVLLDSLVQSILDRNVG
jgi:hypothetical protein